jgi:hypothetical protein
MGVSLVVLFVLACAPVVAPLSPEEEIERRCREPSPGGAPICVCLLPEPGAYMVVNVGPSPVELSRKVDVDVFLEHHGGWQDLKVVGQRLVKCPGFGEREPGCTQMAPGDVIHPSPWDGYTCSGSCGIPCTRTFYQDGPHRLVVHSCKKGGPSFRSEVFEMPPEAP